jgi:thiosulfate dehydrogenase
MSFMKKFLLGLVVGLIVPIVGVFLFFALGGMPVATEGRPVPFERFLVHLAMHAAVKEDIDKKAPFPADETAMLAGAKSYLNKCAGCHGLPNSKAPLFAKTMFPHIPQLFTDEGNVNDDPVGVTYWKVKNGIRLTGMPAFKGILTEDEIWQVSLLVSQTDKLPPSVFEFFQKD